MSFRDEEFIRLMNRGKASVTGDLAHGIFFREERMNFQEKKLLGEKLFVSLPEDFDEMSEENACMRYPMPQRPQIIMTNETESAAKIIVIAYTCPIFGQNSPINHILS